MRLPSHRQIRQLECVVANHPSGFFDLAAAPRQPLAVAAWPTTPRKTRVGVFRHRSSGQTSSRRRCRSIITPGLRGCGYKTVSGRHEWLNQDPIGEAGGLNLYGYVGNNPINYVDPLGLQLDAFLDTGVEIGAQLGARPVAVPLPRIPGVSYPPNGPFPPEGTIENAFRPGSFGRIQPNGKFQECWRFDKGTPGKPGWEGIDHFHYWGGPEHMSPPLPPFQWFSVPPVMNNVNTPSIYPAPPAPSPQAPPPVQYYHPYHPPIA